MLIRILALCLITMSATAEPIRVVVWDEQQPKQQLAYPNFLGNQIAEYLKARPGLSVKSVRLDDADLGLAKEVLDQCDVLIWWGHLRHAEVPESKGQEIVDRIQSGKLALIALHSAHFSTPFMMAMEARARADALQLLSKADREKATVEFSGPFERKAPKAEDPLTPSATIDRTAGNRTLIKLTRPNCCFPSWREDGKPSRVKTLLRKHPVAQGIPAEFTIPQTEMYSEPFHVPKPDEVIFEEHFAGGEWFRSGSFWQVGRSGVFYFRPGHESYKVYFEEYPLKILENTVRWLAERQGRD